MKIRSFIAINLPDQIKKELGFLIEKLKEKNPNKNIKWVKPENIHLTLHFLGYLEQEKIKEVERIIQKSIISLKSTKIELKDFGGFPNLEQPRVLFISCQEVRNTLHNLQKKLGQELERIGLETDHRSWRIHLTMARLKTPLHLLVTNLNKLQLKSFEVKSIDLMKSELTPKGAIYSILKNFSLQ